MALLQRLRYKEQEVLNPDELLATQSREWMHYGVEARNLPARARHQEMSLFRWEDIDHRHDPERAATGRLDSPRALKQGDRKPPKSI